MDVRLNYALVVALVAPLTLGCTVGSPPVTARPDGAQRDAGAARDGGTDTNPPLDAGSDAFAAGDAGTDSSLDDAATADGGPDATVDAGTDSAVDTGGDAGPICRIAAGHTVALDGTGDLAAYS